MTRDDDQLLERLGAALAPPAAEPSPAEVDALHRMVAGHDDAVAVVGPPTRPALGWRLGLVAAAAVVLVIAVVANRPAAESADLAQARTALEQLETAIDRGDRGAVAAALADAERRVDALERTERAEIEPLSSRLEARARALLAVAPTTTVSPSVSAPTTVGATTTVPPPTQTVTTLDDKGGQRDRSGSNSGKG